MKTVSGIIMIIGWLATTFLFLHAESAPQQAAAVVPVIAAYILARALENFASPSAKDQAYFERQVKKNHEHYELNTPTVKNVKQVDQVEQIVPWKCIHCNRLNEVNESVCEKCGKSKN